MRLDQVRPAVVQASVAAWTSVVGSASCRGQAWPAENHSQVREIVVREIAE